MDKHLIVLDLDGTLLKDYNTYNIDTIKYIKHLKDLGHYIIIATGRPFRSSYFIYKILDLNTPIINYNGAFISNPTDLNFKIVDQRLDKNIIFDILDNFKNCITNIFCEIHDDIYVDKYTKEVYDFLHVENAILHEGRIKTTLNDNPNSALIFIKNNTKDEIIEYVNKKYNSNISIRYWKIGPSEILEIYNEHIDKSNNISDIINYYNIDIKNTIAFGDGENDIKMFKSVNIGVAMGNAHPNLKKVASFITDSYDNNGVLNFLKSYFKI